MNKLVKNIYNNSPVWFQNLMISAYGRKLFKLRYGPVYYDALNYYKNKDYTDIEKDLAYQNQELIKLVTFAANNSPFYKKFYSGIDLSKIKSVDDLKLLPILDKETLRQGIEDVYTISPSEGIPSFTGGTTGKSLKVFFTKSDFQKRMAYLDAFKLRLGIDTFNAKKATFSGRDFANNGGAKQNIYWRYNSFYNQKLYSTFDMIEKNLPYYVADLNKFKPNVINGFVSAIYELAKFIEYNNIALTFVPQAIFTTSETLLPVHRELIEKIFDTKVYNQYASGEGAPFITECKEGNLHYNVDTGVIEALETEHGNEMLVTSFTTYGTPLIRYKIGDKIKFKDGICNCGSSHPLVEAIEGRQVDYLLSSTRGKVSLSHLADVIKGLPNCVKAMQFVQDKLDQIDIKLVVDNEIYSPEHESSILNEMAFRFGDDAKINIRIVDFIPREASGKFSLIKNNMVKK